MIRSTTGKRAAGGRRLGRLAMVALAASGAGLVVTVGIGAAAGDPADGRPADAVPGAAIDAPRFAGPVDDGRSAVDRAARRPTVAPAATGTPAVVDNGRGGPDPATGPNPVPSDAARATATESGIDTDSGAVPARDLGPSTAPAAETPADEDVGGASAASGSTPTGPSGGPPAAPVDVDAP